MHDAVVCCLLGLHPLIETKTVMVIVVTIVLNLLYHRFGRRYFKNSFFHPAFTAKAKAATARKKKKKNTPSPWKRRKFSRTNPSPHGAGSAWRRRS